MTNFKNILSCILLQALKDLPDSLLFLKDLDDIRKKLSEECFGIRFFNSRSSESTPVHFYHKALWSTLNGFQQDKREYQSDKLNNLLALLEW